MKELLELKDTLCKELEEYGRKGKMNAGDLEVVDKLTHTIKNLDKIIENYDGEYSNRGYSMRDGDYSNGYSMRGDYSNRYDNGQYSMARGRGSRAKRDSMGRYSSHNDMMIQELRELMEDAPDERTRMEFEQFIKKMEMM